MEGIRFVRGVGLSPVSDLYCFDPLSKSAFRSMVSPANRRHLIIPERRELSWYHRFLFPRPTNPELANSYVAEFFWKNTPVPSSAVFRGPRLAKPEKSWAPARLAPGEFVLLNATSGWRKKMWTATGWAEVLNGLDLPLPVVLTNAGQDWQVAHCEEIVKLSDGRAAVQASSLREFLWMCANARLVLTVDGAASHLAAAFDVPALTLFGPTNIDQWFRSGPRHLAVRAGLDTDGVRRLARLPSDPVIEAAQKLIGA